MPRNDSEKYQDPMLAPSIRQPSFSESVEMIRDRMEEDTPWTRETIRATLLEMESAPARSLPRRAVDVLEHELRKQDDPLGALVAFGNLPTAVGEES